MPRLQTAELTTLSAGTAGLGARRHGDWGWKARIVEFHCSVGNGYRCRCRGIAFAFVFAFAVVVVVVFVVVVVVIVMVIVIVIVIVDCNCNCCCCGCGCCCRCRCGCDCDCDCCRLRHLFHGTKNERMLRTSQSLFQKASKRA